MSRVPSHPPPELTHPLIPPSSLLQGAFVARKIENYFKSTSRDRGLPTAVAAKADQPTVGLQRDCVGPARSDRLSNGIGACLQK